MALYGEQIKVVFIAVNTRYTLRLMPFDCSASVGMEWLTGQQQESIVTIRLAE